jgi:hypothetical protein
VLSAHDRLTDVLSPAAERRMSNQLARAYRGTYGARTGWRTIVRGVARQMLSAGSSAENVSQVFERYVLNHPAGLVADPRNIVTGKNHSQMLVEVAQQCVADIVLEASAA